MPTNLLTTEELLHETPEAINNEESLRVGPTLAPDLLRLMNAYWRAANYVSVGQIYLYDNPLLKEPLKLSHVKPLVVSHWGTTPGQNSFLSSRNTLTAARMSFVPDVSDATALPNNWSSRSRFTCSA